LVFLLKFALSSVYTYEYLYQLKAQKDLALVSDAAHIHLALMNADSLDPPLFQRFQQNLDSLTRKLETTQVPALDLLVSETLPLPRDQGLFLVESGNLTHSQIQQLIKILKKKDQVSFTVFYKNHHIYLTYMIHDPIDLSWLMATLMISAGLILMIFMWWWIFIYYEKKLPGRIFAALIGDNSERASGDPLVQTLKHKIEAHYQEKHMMLTALSHDIKTPLTEAMLKLDLIESPDFLEVSQSIRKNLEQIDLVVRSSLDYAKDSKDLEKIQIDLVLFLQKIIEPYLSRGAAIQFHSDWTELFVSIEIALTRRLVLNLIENALKYGSVVEINLYKDLARKKIALEIHDNGLGVPAKSLSLLGSPYYRVDQSRSRKTGGTGLGLAIVRKIANLHGWEVEFENRSSSIGKGLCVRILIKLNF
jgi:signal transduction histidine kinase